MPLELQRLNLQLENLKVVLEDAITNNKPFFEQTKIVKQISEVEHLIEKRKAFIPIQKAIHGSYLKGFLFAAIIDKAPHGFYSRLLCLAFKISLGEHYRYSLLSFMTV